MVATGVWYCDLFPVGGLSNKPMTVALIVALAVASQQAKDDVVYSALELMAYILRSRIDF